MKVTGGGRGLVNHAGARLLSDVGDDIGLTLGLSVGVGAHEAAAAGL